MDKDSQGGNSGINPVEKSTVWKVQAEGVPSFQLEITEDKMSIFLVFGKAKAQRPLPEPVAEKMVRLLSENLEEMNVSEASRVEGLELFEKFCKGPPPRIEVATARPAERSMAGGVDYLVKTGPAESCQDLSREKRDPRDLGTLQRLVEADQELVRVTKEHQPQPGENVFGEPTTPEKLAVIKCPSFDEETVSQEEDEDGWSLKSRTKGFFHQDGLGKLGISPQIVGKEVSLKSIGNVLGDDTVDIIIKGDKYAEDDAVGEGFHLIGNRIEITGNLGNGVILEGNEIIVHGKISPHCRMISKRSLSVDYVQGSYLQAPDVRAQECWFSEIHGDRIVIPGNIVGSEIRASRALILGEMKNSHVTLSSSLTVARTNEIEPNTLTIDPLARPSTKKKYENLQASLDEARGNVARHRAELAKTRKMILSLMENAIENTLRVNLMIYSVEQKNSVLKIFEGQREGEWLSPLKISAQVARLQEELNKQRLEEQRIEKTLRVEEGLLKMKSGALNRILEQVKTGVIISLQQFGEGTHLFFGKHERVITEAVNGCVRYHLANGVIEAERTKIDQAALRKDLGDFDSLFAKLK